MLLLAPCQMSKPHWWQKSLCFSSTIAAAASTKNDKFVGLSAPSTELDRAMPVLSTLTRKMGCSFRFRAMTERYTFRTRTTHGSTLASPCLVFGLFARGTQPRPGSTLMRPRIDTERGDAVAGAAAPAVGRRLDRSAASVFRAGGRPCHAHATAIARSIERRRGCGGAGPWRVLSLQTAVRWGIGTVSNNSVAVPGPQGTGVKHRIHENRGTHGPGSISSSNASALPTLYYEPARVKRPRWLQLQSVACAPPEA
jgi:hypothetical protein